MDYCKSDGLSSKGVTATRVAPTRGAGSRLRTQSAERRSSPLKVVK
jgi:hypothetical protein